MKTSVYLGHLSENFSVIRKLFGWRQEDAAARIGISRSKVVAIEDKDNPKMLSEVDAQSLFVACEYELYKARKSMEILKKEQNKKLASILISSSLFMASPIFRTYIIQGIAMLRPNMVTKLLPVVGSVLGSMWATKKAKSKKEEQLFELTSDESIDLPTIEKGMEETINEIEQKLLEVFLLNSWDSNELFEKIHPELKLPSKV